MRFAATLAMLLGSAAAAWAQPRLIRGAAWVDESGRLVREAAVIAVEGETIRQVGAASDAVDDDFPGAVLCPGLVDCLATLSASDGLSERSAAVQPALRAADAFDRFARPLRAALEAGVTTFALVPDDENLVGGQVAVCQTAGPDGRPRLLEGAGPLKLSLSPEALKLDREPTSRSGAVGMLRDALAAARAGSRVRPSGEPPGATDALAALVRGAQLGWLTAPAGADVLTALELAGEFRLRLALIHTHDAHEVAELLAGKVAGVIIGPLDPLAGPRDAAAAGRFAARGVPVALAGGLPVRPADNLRIAAAIAARAGLPSEVARRAITATAAELLGVGDRVGSLRAGCQADIVVFSGDPLDLRSRVLAVYVAGRRVYTDFSRAEGESP